MTPDIKQVFKIMENKSLSETGKYNKIRAFKKAIHDNTTFLPSSSSLTQRVWHILNKTELIPTCSECNKELEWNQWKTQYKNFCSRSCATKNPLTRKKKQATCLERYGTPEHSHSTHHKGLLEQYNKNLTTEDKVAKTKKMREVFKKKYNVDWITQDKTFIEKRKQTLLNRDGSLSPVSFGRWKDYNLPDGTVIRIQGYENFALDCLFKIYKQSEILIQRKQIRDICKDFIYEINDIKRHYCPDIFIIPENKIIEVKSFWTYDKKGECSDLREINELKKQSVINAGYKFEFWIFDDYKNLTVQA